MPKAKLLLLLLTGGVIALWLSWPHILAWSIARFTHSDATLQNMGLMGDSFGSLNVILTGLSLIGLVAAILAQSRDRLLLEQQAFETTFFSILGLVRDRHAGVAFKLFANERSGTSAFRELILAFSREVDAAHVAAGAATQSWVGTTYKAKILDTVHYTLDPYLRTIEVALQAIDRYKHFTADQKQHYADILGSQLGSAELYALTLSLLSVERDSALGKLSTKYRLIRRLPDDRHRRDIEHLFPAGTFSPRPKGD